MIGVLFLSLLLTFSGTSAASDVTPDLLDQWTPHPDCPFPAPNQTIYFPVEGDCTKYVQCYEGNRYENECPEGLWWNQSLERCDYPGTYCTQTTTTPRTTTISQTTTTTSRTTTTTTTSRPVTTTSTPTATSTLAPTTTSTLAPTTDGSTDPRCSDMNQSFWPHPVHCNLYIECYQGNSYEMACPTGLYFSDTVKRCVSASQSSCCVANPSNC